MADLKGESLVELRQGLVSKQALKVVSDIENLVSR